MDLSTYIQQWTQLSIHILDVRYTLIPTGKPLPPYRFPANAFLLVSHSRGTSIQPSQASTSVEYQHDMGVTKLEGTPNKIAAADYRIMDTLYALGVYPHATTTYGGSTVLPYMDVDQQNPDILPLGDKINLEAAVESEPDLIIARHIEPAVYEQLSKVAPVIVFRGDGDWREEMKEIATVVGKEQQAEDWLAQYDLKAAQMKEKMAQHIGEDETFLFCVFKKMCRLPAPMFIWEQPCPMI
ncbi:ABC transporter substrate-binding protein [Paenibacillus tundrae]|uniref:ABC-type Fe3+-hydroxamate transport system substrate-binding protein n=1 Tax=Paenibacillus tundrae TaxID=528187 RepID=A0ABT9WI35_9BACL|nr:ABC transporter substrate-binding protein [Paenibacillus tundrae]MDQ0172820.1 ABC-type Fe3+-hydroxamate transport system substrate-binding protein [Paenibacillus tundrae]